MLREPRGTEQIPGEETEETTAGRDTRKRDRRYHSAMAISLLWGMNRIIDRVSSSTLATPPDSLAVAAYSTNGSSASTSARMVVVVVSQFPPVGVF